jgi:hypothetical protein
VPAQEIFSALSALLGPVQYIFFLIIQYFNCLPSPNKLGMQPSWVACLLVSVSALESKVKAKTMKVNKRGVVIKHLYITSCRKGWGRKDLHHQGPHSPPPFFLITLKGLGRHFRFFPSSASQNKHNVRLSVQSSELDPGRHTRLRGRGTQFRRRDRHSGTL